MKAIVYRKYGSPDELKLEEVEKPTPMENEVLIKVHASSINSWDWDLLTGTFQGRIGAFRKPRTSILGCDIAGTVEEVGSNVKLFKPGDDVFGDMSGFRDRDWGAFAEYTCAPENNLILKPSSMTFEEAACLSHGGNLAVQGLIDFGKIKSGQKVLINGGGGSTGTLAIQIANLSDVEVTAVDHTVKLDIMRKLGADHVIDYTKEDCTQLGQKYDLIFDVKTNRSIFNYQRALRPNGIYATVGGQTSRILQVVVFRKLSRKYKMYLVPYKANKDLNYLIELFQADKLKPVIDKCFPLEKTAEAFRYFGEGLFKGKIVVTSGTQQNLTKRINSEANYVKCGSP